MVNKSIVLMVLFALGMAFQIITPQQEVVAEVQHETYDFMNCRVLATGDMDGQ